MNVISSNGIRKIFTLLKNKIDQNKCKVYDANEVFIKEINANQEIIIAKFYAPESGYYYLYGTTQVSNSVQGENAAYQLGLARYNSAGEHISHLITERNIKMFYGGGGHVIDITYLNEGDLITFFIYSYIEVTGLTNNFTGLKAIKLPT